MAIITFWSNSKKQMGQTLSIMAAATYMGMERNYKILLMSTNVGDTSFEEAFGTKTSAKRNSLLAEFGMERKVGLDSGTDGVMKLVSSGKNSPGMITNFTNVVFKNRLEVLFPLKEQNNTNESAYKTILSNANRYYDYVFVDLEKGLNKEYVKEILEMSDVIVVRTRTKEKGNRKFHRV